MNMAADDLKHFLYTGSQRLIDIQINHILTSITYCIYRLLIKKSRYFKLLFQHFLLFWMAVGVHGKTDYTYAGKLC